MIGATRLAGLRNDERGVALVEFACVLPVLLLMYLGGYQVMDALSCNRKVTITARAVADLTTQNAGVTNSSVATILSAATEIMAPYKATNALVRVTELQTDSKGNTTVFWSQDNRGSGLAQTTAYALPTNIKVNGSCIIISEVFYSYTPPVTFGIVGPLSLSDKIYMNSRTSNQISYNQTTSSVCPAN